MKRELSSWCCQIEAWATKAWATKATALWALLARARHCVVPGVARAPVIMGAAGGFLVLLAALIVRTAGGAADVAIPREMPLPQVYEALKKIAQVQSGQEFFAGAHFVGSEACSGCHQKQVEEWRGTWHSKMEQWPTPDTVVGDFTDQVITYRDIEVTDATEKIKQK